jgi:hypothetical protein
MIATRTNDQSALDILVIAQLSALRKWEAEVGARLQSGAAVETIASELWYLQKSVDRLSRMIESM